MIFSRRSEYAVMSYGFSADLSSMKSPNEVSSPSPTGDWSEIGCCAIFMICWTRSTGRFISSATSSGVGSWPYSWSSCFWTLVLDEVPERGVVAVADGGLERDRLLRHLHDLLDAVDGQVHLVDRVQQ